jgi:hypothetical protein
MLGCVCGCVRRVYWACGCGCNVFRCLLSVCGVVVCECVSVCRCGCGGVYECDFECVSECSFGLCVGVFVKLFFVRVCRYLRAF